MPDNLDARYEFVGALEKNNERRIIPGKRGGWRPGGGRPRKTPPPSVPADPVIASARIEADGSIVIDLTHRRQTATQTQQR